MSDFQPTASTRARFMNACYLMAHDDEAAAAFLGGFNSQFCELFERHFRDASKEDTGETAGEYFKRIANEHIAAQRK